MDIKITLPKFGWTMDKATISAWLKRVGDPVMAGEPLYSIETDKASQEIESPASGVLKEIAVEVGESVPVGGVVGILSGAEGAGAPEAPPAEEAAGPVLSFKPIPLSGIRRAIAERMVASLQESAQFTLMMEADITELKARRQPNISPTAYVVKAVAATLLDHPLLNAALVEEEIRVWEQRHIGVAVAIQEGGLVVPVIRNADAKDVEQISAEIDLLVEKARSNQLSEADLSGGTFTVTNLGMFKIDAFTPVLYPPQVAILGVGRWVEKPVVMDGEVKIRTMVALSLTVDHRVVDGAPAAAFLRDLAERLSQREVTR